MSDGARKLAQRRHHLGIVGQLVCGLLAGGDGGRHLGGAAALREKVKARMMPTVVEAKKTWSDPPVDEKEVDEWGEVEDEEY